ncbi:hypothetical protein [Candidatus Methylobacter favarea]|uniref:hypothetical protein n=1 Tax=Candidatus Methylobacter favarea TaxID=2707345 RepID=UPI00157E23D7|nr:hypothetical protein [Candidatus Methylobacter favarea]
MRTIRPNLRKAAYRENIDFKTGDNIFYQSMNIIVVNYLVFMLINEVDVML